MNILVIEDYASSKKGGAERSMRYFCEHLSKQKGINLYFIYHQEGDLVNEINKGIYEDCKQINLYPIGSIGFFNWLKSVYLLVRYCRQHRIDFIFTHIIHAFYTIRLAKILCSFKFIQYFKWIPSTPHIGLLGSWGLKGVDKAYAVSSYTMNYWKHLNSKFDLSNIIADGIPEKEPDHKKTQISIKFKKEKYLLFAGRIYEGKGLHMLIKAIAKIDRFDINLIICGRFNIASRHPDLKYHLYLERLITEYRLTNNVKFAGFVPDISKYIKKSDLVVVPSIIPDAQPLVLLESMRSKKICIGSKIGGIPEVLNEEFSCLLFEPDDSDELALKIEGILETSPGDILKLENMLYNRFKDCYTLEKTNSTLLRCLKSLE